jgi:hypothetical protein
VDIGLLESLEAMQANLLESAFDDAQGQRALLPGIGVEDGTGIEVATLDVEHRDLLAQRFEVIGADGLAQERRRDPLQVVGADDGVADKANALEDDAWRARCGAGERGIRRDRRQAEGLAGLALQVRRAYRLLDVEVIGFDAPRGRRQGRQRRGCGEQRGLEHLQGRQAR